MVVMVGWGRGLTQQIANLPCSVMGTIGSNPIPTVTMIYNNAVIAAIKTCNTKEELYSVFDSFIGDGFFKLKNELLIKAMGGEELYFYNLSPNDEKVKNNILIEIFIKQQMIRRVLSGSCK